MYILVKFVKVSYHIGVSGFSKAERGDYTIGIFLNNMTLIVRVMQSWCRTIFIGCIREDCSIKCFDSNFLQKLSNGRLTRIAGDIV